MIAAGTEGIPPKSDTISLKKSQSNININTALDNPTTKSTASTDTGTSTNSQGLFRTQFQQKTKLLRDTWQQHHLKLTKDNFQLFGILLLTILGLACSVSAIASNRWTCDLQLSFGLWDTCYQPITDGPIWSEANNSTNETIESIQPIKCAKQGVRWVEIELAQQARVNRVYASQALLVSGCILYAFSLVTICLAYRFVKSSSLKSLKNALIASISIQFFAFFLMLIGFYLFILTEQYSVSVGLLFIYFGLAMFASNTINYFTVEYRSYEKTKATACATTCN